MKVLTPKTFGVLSKRRASKKHTEPFWKVMLLLLMRYPVRISTGTHAFMTDPEPGIPISNKEHSTLPDVPKNSAKNHNLQASVMKKILLLLCMVSAVANAKPLGPAEQAVKFNKWYVSQIAKDIYPILDGNEIDKFVTASTMKKLRHTQDPGYGEESDVFYDADLFLKAQDIRDDWSANVAAIAVDSDPVCVNVYIAFGKKQEHVVVDCMAKENGAWKVQSVTAAQYTRNVAGDKRSTI